MFQSQNHQMLTLIYIASFIYHLAACRRDPVGEKSYCQTRQKWHENRLKPRDFYALGGFNWCFTPKVPSLRQPASERVPYPFYIGKYPVTNVQYKRFLNASDYANPVYWLEIPKFDVGC